MRYVSLRFIALTFLAGSAAAGVCAQESIVSGDGIEVTSIDIRAAADQLSPEGRAQALSRKDSIVLQAQQLFVRRALAREAERAGLDKDPAVAAQLLQAKEKVLAEAHFAVIAKANAPSQAQLEAHALSEYKSEPKRFQGPERSRARHILLPKGVPDARVKAEEVLAKLKKGANFEDLAKELSIDKRSGAKGGDLGFLSSGQTVKEFEAAVDAMSAAGQLSQVVETQFGFHIIRLEERRPSGILPFEEVKEALINETRAKRQLEAAQGKSREILAKGKLNEDAIEAMLRQASAR